jgi:hypothetical protein
MAPRQEEPVGTTSPARIDDDLYAWAKLAGSVQSRSASQQVAHWARIGREIEASRSISHREIAQVLAGSRSYDSLDAKSQAVVRAEWSSQMDNLREALDLERTFDAAGRAWVELGAGGAVVERGGPKEGVAAPTRRRSSAAKTTAARKKKQSASSGNAGERVAQTSKANARETR